MQKKKKGISPANAGLWQGCGGSWYSAGSKCKECGKSRIDHISGHIQASQSKRNTGHALDKIPQLKKSLLRVDGAVCVRITRGYRSRPLDFDNLVASCKALRDQIADKILGLTDDAESETLVWEYDQRQGQGVLVQIFTGEK